MTIKKCYYCKKEIKDIGICYQSYGRKKVINYYHYTCWQKPKTLLPQEGVFIFGYMPELPLTCVPVVLKPYGLSNFNGDMTVFDKALQKERGVKIIDKTRFANRNINVLKIKCKEERREKLLKHLKNKDDPLTIKQADKLLEDIKKCKIVK